MRDPHVRQPPARLEEPEPEPLDVARPVHRHQEPCLNSRLLPRGDGTRRRLAREGDPRPGRDGARSARLRRRRVRRLVPVRTSRRGSSDQEPTRVREGAAGDVPGCRVWPDQVRPRPLDGAAVPTGPQPGQQFVGLHQITEPPRMVCYGARWVGEPVRFGAHLRLSTAAVSALGWERETPVLLRWNDTGPLT